MKTINYKGKGEHSVNELELIIEQQAEELHLIKSGQKPLIIDSVSQRSELLLDFIDWFGTWQTDKNLDDYGINDIHEAYEKSNNCG